MIKTLNLAAAALIFFWIGCSRTPDPGTFLASWNAAVGKKDANALWNLLDKDSQGRVLAELQKSKVHSDADKDFKQLFEAMNPSIDPARSPEEMAVGAIGQQIGGAFDPNIDVKTDGNGTLLVWHEKSARIQIEDGQWRAAVGGVGFVTPDGSPVAITLSWPVPQRNDVTAATPVKPLQAPPSRDALGQDVGQAVSTSYFEMKDGKRRAIIEEADTVQPAINIVRTQKDSKGADIAKLSESELDDVLASDRLVPDALAGYHVHIDINGRTTDEVKAGYGQIAQRISKLANLPDAYSDQATRLMFYYESAVLADGPENKPFDVEFKVDTDGSLTATHTFYNMTTRSNDKNVHPRLSFVALPGSP